MSWEGSGDRREVVGKIQNCYSCRHLPRMDWADNSWASKLKILVSEVRLLVTFGGNCAKLGSQTLCNFELMSDNAETVGVTASLACGHGSWILVTLSAMAFSWSFSVVCFGSGGGVSLLSSSVDFSLKLLSSCFTRIMFSSCFWARCLARRFLNQI